MFDKNKKSGKKMQDDQQDMGMADQQMDDEMGMEEQGDTKMRRSNTESDQGM